MKHRIFWFMVVTTAATLLFWGARCCFAQTNSPGGTIEGPVDPLLAPIKAHLLDREQAIAALRSDNERLTKLQHRGGPMMPRPSPPLPPFLPACLVFTELPGTNHWHVSVGESFTNIHIVAVQGTNAVVVKSFEIRSE